MRNSLIFATKLVLPAFLLAGAFVPSATAQNVAAGRDLAAQWCAFCHAVHPGESASDVVPSFEQIAKERGPTEQWLTLWLAEPHQSMPNLSLTRREIADLAAYFESLRGSN